MKNNLNIERFGECLPKIGAASADDLIFRLAFHGDISIKEYPDINRLLIATNLAPLATTRDAMGALGGIPGKMDHYRKLAWLKTDKIYMEFRDRIQGQIAGRDEAVFTYPPLSDVVYTVREDPRFGLVVASTGLLVRAIGAFRKTA